MPNRIIKESICTSEKIASLTDFEFRLWVCLITQADDLGRGDARPAIIKGHAFPLRDGVTNKAIDGAITSLAIKGCINLYQVDGRSYFCFPTWSAHQRIRDCKPRFPGPEDADQDFTGKNKFAATCGELQQPAADCGELRPESNTNPNTNPNPNPKENIRVPRASFKPPTVGEVEEYCQERGNSVNAANFVDFYASKGWKIGNSPMKDWRAAVRTWERRESEQQGKSAPSGANRFANLERLYKQFGGEP